MTARELEISEALSKVEAKISAAAAAAGRARSEVTLIAVTKTYPASDVEILKNLGIENFGENRSDEGGQKAAQVPSTWHFQGQIQSRKLREIATWASYIHSLDSFEHAEKLSRICTENDRQISIFLQLSLDGAPDRGGVIASELNYLAEQVSTLPNLKLAGLMCVPPLALEHQQAFSKIAEIHSAFVSRFPEAKLLSAGMSSDFEEAIKNGATHIRVGSQILGSRPYHP